MMSWNNVNESTKSAIMSPQSTQRPPFLILCPHKAPKDPHFCSYLVVLLWGDCWGLGWGGVGVGVGGEGGGKESKEKSQPHRHCLKQMEAQNACAESTTLTADENWLFHGTAAAPRQWCEISSSKHCGKRTRLSGQQSGCNGQLLHCPEPNAWPLRGP